MIRLLIIILIGLLTTTQTARCQEWVDLGLPSGVLWATQNIGADSPEESGDFYAWGEPKPKKIYSCLNSWTHTARMNDIGGDSTFDTAHRLWGYPWRLPSQDDILELIDNCEFSWIEVKGRQCAKLTSRINGKSILLPASGFKIDDEHCGDNSYADYWSSCPFEYGRHSAYTLMICEGGVDLSDVYRYTGRPIRPVIHPEDSKP